MNPFRSLFGSSARQAGLMPEGAGTYEDPQLTAVRANPAVQGMIPQSGGTTVLRGDPNGDTIIDRQIGAGAEARLPPTMVENPERSYLGGLIKYQPVEGQTGADRLALFGAAMADAGASLQGGPGGSLARVQDQFRERTKRGRADADQAEVDRIGQELYGDDPEALALWKLSPDKLLEQRLEARKPAKPVLVNTRLGPRLYNPDTGAYTKLEDIPERLPPGYRYDDAGEVQLDPAYLAGQSALADTRAAASARHRAPHASGGGAARPQAASGGTPPWQRTW